MSALVKDNPEFTKIKLVAVDWNLHRGSELVETLRIPRQGTLVMFNKGEEVERLVAQTAPEVIEAMFKAVL